MPRKKSMNEKYYKFNHGAYINEWQKVKMKAYTFKFHREIDADIIEKLEAQKSKRGYIVGLIRQDINKNK